MKVYPCGITVTIKANSEQATITGVTIRFKAVAYELSYFASDGRKEIWVNECEFTTDIKKQSIGFIKHVTN